MAIPQKKNRGGGGGGGGGGGKLQLGGDFPPSPPPPPPPPPPPLYQSLYLLCICQAQQTAWPMLCPTITPLPLFCSNYSQANTHPSSSNRPTGALQNPTGLFNTILSSLHSQAVRFTALCLSYSLQPSAYSWHTSGSSTHNHVLLELRYPIP